MSRPAPDPSLPLPPGSFGLPIVGETLAWAADAFTFMEERARRHGPIFKTRLFGGPVVCCAGPEALARFYDDGLIRRSGASPPHLEALIGAGTLPFVDGDEQRRNKQWMLAAVDDEALEGYLTLAAPVFDRAIERWERRGDFRWFPEMEETVLAAFDRVFTGADEGAEGTFLKSDLDRFLAGILALPLPVPWGTYRRALRARTRLVAALRAAVEARRASPRADVISRLLAAGDLSGASGVGELDRRIAAEMLHLVFAGYGTMAAALTDAVLALSRHPALADRLRAEVRELPDEPGRADLEGLDFAGRLWKETLRAFPIVPQTLFGRVITSFECGGYRVPAGWSATACIHASLQNGETFASPDRFDPERFATERAEDAGHPFAYVPQGGGPADGHRCLGERPSRLLGLLALTRFARCDWTLVDPDVDVDRKAFPPRPRGGVAVRGFRRGIATDA